MHRSKTQAQQSEKILLRNIMLERDCSINLILIQNPLVSFLFLNWTHRWSLFSPAGSSSLKETIFNPFVQYVKQTSLCAKYCNVIKNALKSIHSKSDFKRLMSTIYKQLIYICSHHPTDVGFSSKRHCFQYNHVQFVVYFDLFI